MEEPISNNAPHSEGENPLKRRRSKRKYRKVPKKKAPEKPIQKRGIVIMILGCVALLVIFLALTLDPADPDTAPVDYTALDELPSVNPQQDSADPADTTPIYTVPPKVIAEAFISAKGAEEKLKWVRNPDIVRDRVLNAPPELLDTKGLKVRNNGPGLNTDTGYMNFMVSFPSGKQRLLSVIPEKNGPRIDWDSYARHGSATWEQLLSEQVGTADIQVIIKPSDHYAFHYRDEEQWRSFVIHGPDLDRSIYAYTERGSKMDQVLQKLPASRGISGLRSILRLTSVPGSAQRRQFTISHVLASDWVMPSRSFQDTFSFTINEALKE